VKGASQKPNYGMMEIYSQLEEIIGNKLEMAGPMMESFLKEAGKSIASK
jgi:hypothetical protein